MTTITKIFVILVCLFAFIFTPLAIQFAAQTHNWRELAMSFRDDAETALAQARSAVAVGASTVEHYKALQDREHERVIAHQQRIAELEREFGGLQQEHDRLARSRARWESSAQLLAGEMAVKSDHNRELLEERKQILADHHKLQARNVQLNDRVRELSANLVVIAQQLKQKNEELVAVRAENAQFREAMNVGAAARTMTSTPTPSVKAITPPAPSPIHGEVTAVRGNLATIDVGSASGLKEGTEMVVYRGADYIGDLVVESVRPNEAEGRITLEWEGKRVRVNDLVVDAVTFTNR